MTGMEVTSLLLILFSVLIIVLGIVKVYAYPRLIAVQRDHPQAKAIEVCSLLGLLAFPLWMAALVWAYAGVIGNPLPAAEDEQVATVDSATPDSDNATQADEDT